MTDEKTLEQVYTDRNALAVAFAEALNALGTLRADYTDHRGCWKPDQGDDADADEWAIVYGFTPEGQVSWHVPRELAEQSNLPKKHVEWDGHDRDKKNTRLLNLAGVE